MNTAQDTADRIREERRAAGSLGVPTPQETPMPTATRLAVRIRASVDEATAGLALMRHATASPHETTRPVVVHTLGGKAAQLARFQPDRSSDWTIRLAPHTLRDGRWVVEWDRTTLYVPDLADVQLARTVIDARTDLGRELRRTVLATVDALGLPNRRQYLRPAARA